MFQRAMTDSVRMTVTANRTAIGDHDLFRGRREDVIAEIGGLIDEGGKHLVITPNVDQVLDLRTSSQARAVFSRASLRLVDGAPLLFLAKALGDDRISRITGADLLPLLCAHAVENGWRVVITGGQLEVASKAAQRLKEMIEGLDISVIDFPLIQGPADEASESVVAALCEAKPALVFLCLGFPKQESWFLQWEDRLPDAIYFGVGAAADFAAGHKRRAPSFVQSVGGEWLWRLAQEPRRLAHRYLIKGPGFLRVALDSITAPRLKHDTFV